MIDAMEDGESRSIGSSNIREEARDGGPRHERRLADTDEIIYHKVPVWFRRYARGFRPGRNELESVNRPVTIGGVLVRPGDVVVADGDGVVVVPRAGRGGAKASLPFLDNITRERYIKETGRTVGQEARRRELRARNERGRRGGAQRTKPRERSGMGAPASERGGVRDAPRWGNESGFRRAGGDGAADGEASSAAGTRRSPRFTPVARRPMSSRASARRHCRSRPTSRRQPTS